MRDSDIVYLGQPPLRIDLLRAIAGVDTHGVFARAVTGRWEDLELRFISIADLIRNKKTAGRPQDIADATLLDRVQARARE